MLTEITENTSNTDAASLDTASFTPAVGQLFFIAGKRTDSASMASDDWVITQTGSTWDLVATRLFTGTSAWRLSVFRCSAAGSAAVAAMTVDTAVNINRRKWSVQEPSSPLNGTVVQSAVNSNTFSTTPGVTLSAFGNAANWTVLCCAQDGGTGTFTAESVDWTTPTDQGPGVFVVTYLDANDTSPSGTWNTNRSWGAIGLELEASVAPVTGFVLTPGSGVTNGSGVLTTTATSDDALTANGAVRLITATVNGTVVARLTHRPA